MWYLHHRSFPRSEDELGALIQKAQNRVTKCHFPYERASLALFKAMLAQVKEGGRE
jgi:hypothetical protein